MSRLAARRGWIPAVVVAGLWALLPVAGPAQEAEVGEIELLRDATRQEAAGDLAGAESLLREVIALRPASLPALLSLERILRPQRRLDELVPVLEAALARDRTSVLLNRLRVRTLGELDRLEELEAAADAWIAAVPELEVPYRGIGEVWLSRNEPGRARAVLEEGRRRIGRPDALALELGDVYAALGEHRLAVVEWARVIDDGGGGLSQVRRRVRSLPGEGERLVPQLVDRVAREPAPPGRLRAALNLAVEAGLEDRAWALMERVVPGLSLEERRVLVENVARRSDESELDRLAYRAYSALLEIEGQAGYVRERSAGGDRVARGGESDGVREMVIRSRLAELARSVGDTTAAARSYRTVEDVFEPGTPQRREATAQRIELLAGQDPERAREELEEFVAAHPDAPAVDGLSAVVARALVRAGLPADGELVVAGLDGPRSALVRAGLMLERREMERARGEYLRAAAGLEGAEATRVLSLVRLLTRLPPEAGPFLSRVLRFHEGGVPGEAVEDGVAGAAELAPADRPPLLDFLAELAGEAGLEEEAAAIRRRIIVEHPHSGEAPRALLALGRELAREPGDRSEARELLERLVLEYPRSALVPQARRELERLRREGAA